MSRSHARFSPSKLGAKEKCSKFDYEQTPAGTVNESADEGELMHKAYETGDLSILQTEEQRAQVEKVIQYTDTLTAGLDASRFTSLSEIKLEIPDYTFGYADRIIIVYDENKNIKEAHILDAKFGRKGADDADSNAQIMCYAGGLLFGNVYFNDVDPDSQLNVPVVHGHIVAPRLDSITTVTYTQDDKPRILGRLEAILRKANDPFDPPTPNSDLCPNCQWRATCPAVNQLAARTSQALDQFIPSIVDPSRLSSASPEDKSRAYALAQILESWSEAAKKTITQSIMTSGQDLPNYQKVKRAGSIKIANTQEAMAMMQGVVPESVVMQSATLSLSKLADAYAEHTGETKRESRDRIEEILGPVLERAPDITFFQRKRGVSERDILSSVPQIQISNNTPQPE